VDDEHVYLVPIGAGRFELYSEPSDEAPSADGANDGFWVRQARRLHEWWRAATHAAHAAHAGGLPEGRLARARNWTVGRIADSIAQQRTLWSLRGVTSASLVHPSDLSGTAAALVRTRLLGDARRRNAWWLLVDTLLVIVAAFLVLLPGPNLIGYYFVFRAISHFLGWRGARQALQVTAWTERPEPMLAELGRLALVPCAERADRVAQIAAALGLPRLDEFFDRAAGDSR